MFESRNDRVTVSRGCISPRLMNGGSTRMVAFVPCAKMGWVNHNPIITIQTGAKAMYWNTAPTALRGLIIGAL